MSDFFYIDANTKSYVEKTSQANISKGLYNNYQIGRSCLFNSSLSQDFRRTPSVSGNRASWTFSCWIKKTKNESAQSILTGWDGVSTSTVLQFTSGDALELYNYAGAYYARLISTQVFRDVSSWYHIVAVWDSNNPVSSDRQRLYVNGERIRAFSTESYTADESYGVNRASYVQYLAYTSGFYISEINFIDGQSLDSNSFGYLDNQKDFVWKPKKYTGIYGTNGYYINFGDSTSSSTMGRDFSGNGNNFSINGGMDTSNLLNDVPTNNYPIYNALAKNSAVTVSENGITFSSTNNRAQGTTFVVPRTGKWYAEFTPLDAVGVGGTFAVGVIGADTNFIGGSISMITTSSGIQTIAYIDNANRNVNGTISASGGATYGINDVIGVAVDADNGSVSFYKGNSLQFTVSGSSYTTYSGNWMFAAEASASSKRVQFNAGQRSFTYTPPSGFRTLCAANMPIPSIKKSNIYFDAKLYNGTSSIQTIDGFNFSPDLLWIKGRNVSTNGVMFDTVRGTNKEIQTTNTVTTETTRTDAVTSFNNNGFTVGADAGTNVNYNTGTFVAWAWDTGSSNSTNTDGSITSTVRVNKDAGFSIVSFTKTLSTATQTVGHGLGAVPKMMIVKGRTSNATSNWRTWHTGISISKYLNLNNTDGEATSTQMWANTNPTSSVFSIGSDFAYAADANYIAYLFAEVEGYSKFGSYTGNGAADGPFVYCGFRPKWVMVKETGALGSWFIIDSERSYNGLSSNMYLSPNTTNSDYGNEPIDILSNGFKLRYAGGSTNGNTDSLIFAAFAETPFKYALAR